MNVSSQIERIIESVIDGYAERLGKDEGCCPICGHDHLTGDEDSAPLVAALRAAIRGHWAVECKDTPMGGLADD